MNTIEFHFNSPTEKEIISGKAKLTFDSFCYEPSSAYEKKMGNLYVLGALKNVLPKNIKFLHHLAGIIKEGYYSPPFLKQEKQFSESLKKANTFLEKIVKSGDVSWLGNLEFAIISLSGFKINLTKVGKIKIILLREGEIIDIDKRIVFPEIEPYPLRIFSNVVTGKLAENDMVLVLTQEVFDCFKKNNILEAIANIDYPDGKRIKKILEENKEHLLKISGVCMMIVATKRNLPDKQENISLPPREFSFKTLIKDYTGYLKKLYNPKKWMVRGYKINRPKKTILKTAIAKFSFPRIRLVLLPFPRLQANKNVVLIIALIFFLVTGFLISRNEKRKQLEIYQANLSQIQKEVDQAESLLILRKTTPQVKKQIEALLKKSFEEISPLIKISFTFPEEFRTQILSLNERILNHLYQINHLTKINQPKIIFESKPKEFIPQKITANDKTIYLYSPYSTNLLKIGPNNESRLILVKNKINLSTVINKDAVLFFSNPNKIIIFKNGKFVKISYLKIPYSDFDFRDLSSYRRNLYFLDKKFNQIVKYQSSGEFNWQDPEFWLRKSTGGNSIAIDGSIWILEGKSISKYYMGSLQKKIDLVIFPPIKKISKIFTSSNLPYLYLLEPIQKRIIIMDKSGEIIKQFQSDKFDNLLDFAVSQNGKKIYLLNGLKVYKIDINQ